MIPLGAKTPGCDRENDECPRSLLFIGFIFGGQWIRIRRLGCERRFPMQHPFAGPLSPESHGEVTPERQQSRRFTVARMIGALGAVGCLIWGRSSQAAQRSVRTPTTMALGEEGGSRPPQPPPSPRATTLAVGEEGGGVGQRPQPARPTTQAVGEEGGAVKPVTPPRSKAIGDSVMELLYGDPFLD